MKTFYYSIRETSFSWDTQTQFKIQFTTWIDFVNFCYQISFHTEKEVRACETKGYNNQGSYFKANIHETAEYKV